MADPRPAASLAVVTTLLVSPHSLLYDPTLWAIPLVIFWRELSAGKRRWLIAAGYLTPWFVSLFGMLGAGFVWPTVTVSALAFVLLARERSVTDVSGYQD